jgi:hypothetical protein
MEPATREEITRYGIISPHGDLWTDDTFRDPRHAWKHLREFWDQPGFEDMRDISRFQVVPVVLTIVETLADGKRVSIPNELAKQNGE